MAVDARKAGVLAGLPRPIRGLSYPAFIGWSYRPGIPSWAVAFVSLAP